MSSISVGTTTTTGYVVTSDSTGALVLKTGASATTAVTIGSDQSVTFAGSQTFSGGTANGVLYLNGSKVATSGSALTFDGTTFTSVGQVNIKNDLLLSDSTAIQGRAYGDASGVVWRAESGLAQRWHIGSTEQMRLTSTGLGIGTSSPNYPATIYKATFPTLQFINSASGTGGGDGLLIYLNGTTATISNEESGPLTFQTAGTLRATLDSSGNLGLGVTPSAWINAYKALEIGNTTGLYGRTDGGTMEFALALNGYRASSGSWIYRNTGAAARYNQNSGAHWWDTAASGTAGNTITFTQAMTLDASGNLQLGTTTNPDSARFRVYGISEIDGNGVGLLKFKSSGTTIGSAGQGNYVVSGGPADGYGIQSATSLVFGSGGTTERARITSGGNFLIGGTSSSSLDGVFGAVIGGSSQSSAGVALEMSTSQWLTYTDSTQSLRFYDSRQNVERAQIDSSGNLLVNTTTPAQSNSTNNVLTLRSAGVAAVWGVGPTTSFGTFYISNVGTGVALTQGSTSWGTVSDERLKEIIEPITDATNKVSMLRAVIGKYKTDADGARRSFLIAQDVLTVLPEAIDVGEDEAQTLSVKYTETIPLLVAAIKEQQALIETLTQRITALEGR